MEYTFVFAGIQAAPQGVPIVLGITVRVILYIKTRRWGYIQKKILYINNTAKALKIKKVY
jgi:hypothetical protein